MKDAFLSEGDRHSGVMRHTASRTLYGYWSRLRRGRRAPERWEFEPADIAPILGSTFILEAETRQSYAFRLAGTRLCLAFGHELRSRDWLASWDTQSREAVATVLNCVVEDVCGAVVIGQHTAVGNRSVEIEWTLLPLMLRNGTIGRIIGTAAPLTAPHWLGDSPLVSASLRKTHFLWLNRPFENAPLESAGMPPAHARRHRHLLVFDGGRDD